MGHANPTAMPATQVGRTKRAVKAYITVIRRLAQKIECTVPKGTPVGLHGDAWYVSDLDWLERCEEEKIVAAGRPAGQGRATTAYHWASQTGIEIDASDVEPIHSARHAAPAAASRRPR
jgi:hypothetical protein